MRERELKHSKAIGHMVLGESLPMRERELKLALNLHSSTRKHVAPHAGA